MCTECCRYDVRTPCWRFGVSVGENVGRVGDRGTAVDGEAAQVRTTEEGSAVGWGTCEASEG